MPLRPREALGLYFETFESFSDLQFEEHCLEPRQPIITRYKPPNVEAFLRELLGDRTWLAEQEAKEAKQKSATRAPPLLRQGVMPSNRASHPQIVISDDMSQPHIDARALRRCRAQAQGALQGGRGLVLANRQPSQ